MTSPFIDGLKAQRLVSANGINQAAVVLPGSLQVSPPAYCLLNDSFDGTTIDTTYRWNSPVLSGAGAITQSNGLILFTTGTGASSAAALSSIEYFTAIIPGFLNYGAAVFMEAAPGINTHRFMGVGTPNPSYTAATPLQDACGWEYDITGKFNACVYSGGVRTVAQQFNTPTGGVPTLLTVLFRTDAAYFFINNLEEPVFTQPAPSPNFATLPFRMHIINHTSGPASAPIWNATQAAVSDTGNNYPLLFNGQVILRARTPGKFVSVNAVSIATETTVWTPASGRRFRLMGYQLSSTGAQNIVLKDNTAGSTILVIPGVTAGQLNFSPPMGNGILSVAPNNVLTANAGGANTVSGYFFGTEE